MKTIQLKYYILSLLIVVTAASCRKVIDLKLGNNTGQLVIEANVVYATDHQYVKLSRNVPFTNTNNYPAVTGANITVTTEKGTQYQFTESTAGMYVTDHTITRTGGTYKLSVAVDGKAYTAYSTMPETVALDSVTSKKDFFDNSKNKQIISVHFQDPQNVVNQYRFVMYVNSVQVKNVFAFNDDLIDGKYVNLDLQQNYIDIYPRDTVTVEMQCIDKPVYTYWFTLSQQQDTNPGGSVAPANPPTNISPVTLGYFSAHTSQTITKVIK